MKRLGNCLNRRSPTNFFGEADFFGKMKILYIAPYTSLSFRASHGDIYTPSIGGLRKIELIVMALTQAGHTVVVLSSAMLSISRLSLRSETCEVINLECGGTFKVIYPSALMLRPLGGFINCMRAAGFVRRIVDEFKPDAAIVYNTYLFESLAVSELLRSKKIPICLEIEDLPLARRRGLFNLKPLLDQFCWNGMLKKVSSFLAVNQFILDKLPDNKPKTLLPGVIDQKLLVQAKTRSRPYAKSERLLGYFGALTAEKGVKVLLELVPKLEPPWQLVVTGSGPLSNEFELISEKFPERFHFLGSVSEQLLYSTMCSCDCVVIPLEQITDGGQGVFPFKTLEYLISGSHIISTPLALQNELDLSYIMRWDGSLSNLLTTIKRSESDYNNEAIIRTVAIDHVLSRYTTSGINKLLTEHLLKDNRLITV